MLICKKSRLQTKKTETHKPNLIKDHKNKILRIENLITRARNPKIYDNNDKDSFYL